MRDTIDEWKLQAACAYTDADIFSFTKTERQRAEAARVCFTCPVRVECTADLIEATRNTTAYAGYRGVIQAGILINDAGKLRRVDPNTGKLGRVIPHPRNDTNAPASDHVNVLLLIRGENPKEATDTDRAEAARIMRRSGRSITYIATRLSVHQSRVTGWVQ